MRKATTHFLKQYFVASFLIITILMLIHYPNTFFNGNSLFYIYDSVSMGHYGRILEFFLQLLLYSILFIPFLIFSKVKYFGWIPLAMFSFFTGLEKYIFYLQGNYTPWNIAFNEDMLINFMVNPTGIEDSFKTYGGDINFYLLLFVFPIILFLVLLFVRSKLPKMVKNDLYYSVKMLSLAIIVLLPTFFPTPSYVPYMFRVHHTIIEKVSDTVYEFTGITRLEPYFKNIVKEKTPKNILFIMDESVRGDLLSINNPTEKAVMEATPFLYSMKDKIVNFGNLYSLTNCSYPSNELAFLGTNFKEEKVVPNYMKTTPSIFQYMQNAGYKTYFVDNVHNGLYMVFKTYDRQYLDVVVNDFNKYQNIKSYDRDLRTLDEVRSILNNGEKNFIFVVKYGNHFPYENAFDLENPTFEKFGNNSGKEEFNLYMNSINFTVDRYWKYLVDVIGKTDTVALYQSDHAVNISRNKDKDRVVLTHCENGLTSFQEMHSIPGILYSPNKDWYKGYSNLKHGYSASHMFPTVLEFAGYDENDYSSIYGNSFKNPETIVEIKNVIGLFSFGDENTSNIFGNVNEEDRKNITDYNKRRVLPNTLPDRKFINKEIELD